mgnify:CR=1 FL=1
MKKESLSHDAAKEPLLKLPLPISSAFSIWSASSFFFSCSCIIFSSMVPLAISLYTLTTFSLFSQFTTMLDRICDEFRKEGISYFILTGATSKEERRRLVESFQTSQSQSLYMGIIELLLFTFQAGIQIFLQLVRQICQDTTGTVRLTGLLLSCRLK